MASASSIPGPHLTRSRLADILATRAMPHSASRLGRGDVARRTGVTRNGERPQDRPIGAMGTARWTRMNAGSRRARRLHTIWLGIIAVTLVAMVLSGCG